MTTGSGESEIVGGGRQRTADRRKVVVTVGGKRKSLEGELRSDGWPKRERAGLVPERTDRRRRPFSDTKAPDRRPVFSRSLLSPRLSARLSLPHSHYLPTGLPSPNPSIFQSFIHATRSVSHGQPSLFRFAASSLYNSSRSKKQIRNKALLRGEIKS
uniref:Uncharacterized protein n=1 Tax=Plectus sambesii TaxID=2011161 RepID=A0A914WTH9_9BILA